MQLVDEGLLDLDAPVAEVLPGFRVADPDVTRSVTTRHLLAHTSGIDGDVFTDTGRGDECIERYVAGMADFAQNHPLGATWSYCNSGYVLAGRLVEHLTGMTWDAALRERLAAPLGLTHTVTLPEEALLHRTAVGHVGEPDEDPVPATSWALSRSMGPAGMVTASVEDVLTFARMHLDGGLAADGTRVLSAAAVEAMAAKEADLPDTYTLGDSWGLGWIRFGWDGERLLGHDGNTIGQSAFLRVLPFTAAWRSRSSRTAATRRISSTTSTARSSARRPASRSPRRSSPGRRRRMSTRSGTSAATSARG